MATRGHYFISPCGIHNRASFDLCLNDRMISNYLEQPCNHLSRRILEIWPLSIMLDCTPVGPQLSTRCSPPPPPNRCPVCIFFSAHLLASPPGSPPVLLFATFLFIAIQMYIQIKSFTPPPNAGHRACLAFFVKGCGVAYLAGIWHGEGSGWLWPAIAMAAPSPPASIVRTILRRFPPPDSEVYRRKEYLLQVGVRPPSPV